MEGERLVEVPLEWSGHPAPTGEVLGFEDAAVSGLVTLKAPGEAYNGGSAPVLALPGDRLGAGPRPLEVAAPALIPPAGRAHVQLRPGSPGPGGEMVSVSATGGATDSGSPDPRCGTVVFVDGEPRAILVLPGPRRLRAYVARQSWPASSSRPTRPQPLPSLLHRTRRLFFHARYCEARSRWEDQGYRLVDLVAPQIRGWAALAGKDLLALELRPEVSQQASTAPS